MKIGIVGPADRAVAWENHLRPHRTVQEVVITANIEDVGEVDACLILDESKHRIETLLKAIRSGYHSFLVSALPTNLKEIEKVYHSAEEANILLQFAHWPTFAPASQWMRKKIAKPAFIQVIREISYTQFLERTHNFRYYWIDELAFCLKWIDGNVHHTDVKDVNIQGIRDQAMHFFLRFDSGDTANIFISSCASNNRHQRFASNYSFLVDCDVHSQTVRLGQVNDSKHFFFEKQVFDASETAEIAATQFIKSIQLNRPTPYSGYDLLKLANQIKTIEQRLDYPSSN